MSLVVNQSSFDFLESNSFVVAGVDEVGRGPLIGDVVAAAVILRADCDLPLQDSKKLSESKRNELAEAIKAEALAYSIAHATPEEIDHHNILHATMLCMKRAIEGLAVAPTKVLVDGNRCPDVSVDCESVIKGDDKVLSISAASILAKVTRDAQMLVLDRQYPEYGFAKHKGYPTKQHIEEIRINGLIPGNLYRKTFKPVKALLQT